MRIQKIAAADGFSCRIFAFWAVILGDYGENVATNRSLLRPTFFNPQGILAPQRKGAMGVVVYLDLVILLNIVVDGLLLLAAQHLIGMPPNKGRIAAAAVFGGIYAGACFLPGLSFLSSSVSRLVSLLVIGGLAYGWNKNGARQCLLFVILAMALGGAMVCFGDGGLLGTVTGALMTVVVCAFGFRFAPGASKYVQVALEYKGKKANLLALCDTGNTLRDPVTGQCVLVVNAQAAYTLLGLTKDQLLAPAETLLSSNIEGLRLIPYRSVGQSNGMLLAIRLHEVIIGKWKGSTLVAFAPSGLDAEGAYQALTGGMA